MANPETIDLTQARYDELYQKWQKGLVVLTTSKEEARLWCQVNKGTTTLEEGLRACTPAELYNLLSQCIPGQWLYCYNWIWEFKKRLEAREQAAVAARGALIELPTIPLEEVEE